MWRVEFKDRARGPAPRSAGLAGAASKQELPAGRSSPAKEPVYAPGDPDSCWPLRPRRGLSAAPGGWPAARGQGLYPQGFGLPSPAPSSPARHRGGSLPQPSPGRWEPRCSHRPLCLVRPCCRGAGSCAPAHACASPPWHPGQQRLSPERAPAWPQRAGTATPRSAAQARCCPSPLPPAWGPVGAESTGLSVGEAAWQEGTGERGVRSPAGAAEEPAGSSGAG